MQLSAEAFGYGKATTDKQRILYDRATGKMAYAPDGTGSTAPRMFAILNQLPLTDLEHPHLDHTMFFII
ncbi:hypothetical protein [Microvirga terricola]|uniref:Uncharacterized protein n=1 Tax=Microvirga terricola TaxID=2719797 RepID=A0ABX0V6M9_9HYPH|nr:hypothetical protein [Microvirga terricola]NIX75490.1 hypothetical protein [Microvirga terricola]